MIGDPKEKSDYINKLMLAISNKDPASRFSELRLSVNSLTILQILGTGMQIMLGLGVLVLGILNLIRPLWLSMFFSILGSVATLTGLWSAFRLYSNIHVFDSLIRKAIRRVIEFRN